MTYLYIIGSSKGSTSFKVGITKNLKQRLRTLQGGNPDRLNVLWIKAYDSRQQALAIEKLTKIRLQRFSAVGEWYRVNWQQLVATVNDVAEPAQQTTFQSVSSH